LYLENIQWFLRQIVNRSNLTAIDATQNFSADDGSHGEELLESDGMLEGTLMIKDIYSVTVWSEPMNLTAVNGTLFFSADDGIYGRELWALEVGLRYDSFLYTPSVFNSTP
jgi:ELWxxDGT repeat protein